MLNKIFLRKILALIVCAMGVWNAAAQSGSTASQTEKQTDIVSDDTGSSIVDETTLAISDKDVPYGSGQKRGESFVFIAVRMVIVLAFVLACVYAVMRLMRQNTVSSKDNDPFLRRVSSISLSPGKSVQVITLLDNAYLIGVSDNAVNLIGHVNDKELVDAMNLYADRTSKNEKPRSFSDILSLFMGGTREDANVFNTSAKTASDLIRRQRERLRHQSDDGDKNENQ